MIRGIDGRESQGLLADRAARAACRGGAARLSRRPDRRMALRTRCRRSRAMTDLGRELREHLATRWETRALEIEALPLQGRHGQGPAARRRRRPDRGRADSRGGRNTLCVSTQVGCPLACSFCATGALGFTRNLTTAEIVDQVLRMRVVLRRDDASPTSSSWAWASRC